MYASDAIRQLKCAIIHLESHLTAPTSIAEVAASVGYSRYHFSRLFLAVTGITPVAYLRKRRLTEAARALGASSKRILDVVIFTAVPASSKKWRRWRLYERVLR